MTIAVASRRQRHPRPLRLRIHSLLRWLHIYTSMVSLVAVLFFAATGITLNHPDWLAGESTRELDGKLPGTWKTGAGVDWMVVDEFLRSTQGVHGTVSERSADDVQASMTFKAPGYAADCFIKVADGTYRLTVSYQGAIGVLNDLHRGRDAGRSWAWLIDAAGYLLVFLSLTGLGLLWYLEKVRLKGFATLVAGGLLLGVLAKLVS